MGRKIPGKKHKGVKDPEKQRSHRLNNLKGKINAPPSNPDLQEVPHSIKRIAELKEQIKNRKLNENHKPFGARSSLHPGLKGKFQNKKKHNVAYQQFKGESDRHFLQRVHKACDAIIHEKHFENKYGVDIKRNPTTGEVEKLVKKPKDEIDQLLKKVRKNKKQKKSTNSEPVLTKSQKRQKKLIEKKKQKLETANFVSQDVVKFGEVVHEPPSLSLPRRVVKLDGAARPGERNLLLKTLFENTASESTSKTGNRKQTLKKAANKTIDKSGKRKNLPNALRRRLEKQQSEVISAYRMLKKQKNLQHSV